MTEHSDYVCMAEIPACFTEVVVTAEDPNFYRHSGVDPYFIGVAMAENLRNRRFKKGASTITMQLCKNIFFHNDKCISRKIDEMIVAWLLENFLDLSKEQILETYLNIIEFAEGVYGIKAAATYYFNKEVAGMNLLECITMSYVIPRPKFFLEALLMRSTQLLTNLRRHIDYHLRKLRNNGKISKETFLGIDYSIRFELNAFNNEIITLKL
jgi:membrane peptidoglycan carboxypeptidase